MTITRGQIFWAGAALLVALAFGFAGLRWTSEKAETGVTPSSPPSSSDKPFAQGPERAPFITNAVASCTTQMTTKEPLGRHLSDGEIQTYCLCYANGMADAVTTDEVNQMARGAPPIDVVRDKVARISQACEGQLPPK